MHVLRWLLFFVLGDVLCAVGVPAVVVPLVTAWEFLGALWDAGFDFETAGIFFDIRTEHRAPFVEMVIFSAFLPGLIAAFFLAKESLEHESWAFWRWRSGGY